MSRKNVPASEVRAWARDNIDAVPEAARAGLGESSRGRLHPEIVAAFRKANKGLTYEAKVAQSPTMSVKFAALDSLGRKTTRTATLTTRQARELLGQVEDGKATRGRFSAAHREALALVLEAQALEGAELSNFATV